MDNSRRQGDHDGRIESVEQRGERIVVLLSWADKEGKRHEWAHALRLRDGKIIGMQDYANPARAAAATHLRALFG